MNRAADDSWYVAWGKRMFDLALGLAIFLFTLPVVVVLSLGSLIAFRAWPLFVQVRIGKDEKPFRFPKIRTLPASAPRAVDKYALEGVRTNWYGRALRGTHLDELPQFALVVSGHMSLVGPRPEMPELLDRYSTDFRELRARVRPGCTGLWQISESASGLIYEAPEYDVYYVNHLSFRLDARVAWQTLRALVRVGDRSSAASLGASVPDSLAVAISDGVEDVRVD